MTGIAVRESGLTWLDKSALDTDVPWSPDGESGLFDVGFRWPLVTLRRSALEHNAQIFSEYCADAGMSLAPHAKSTMMPALWALQLEAGAWGLTAATPSQVQIQRRLGTSRILLANELVDRGFVPWISAQLDDDPEFEFFCYVDSQAGIDVLAAGGSQRRRPISVLLEIGFDGGRTGCRDAESALAIAEAAAATPGIALVGVSGYEGGLGANRSDETLGLVRAFARRIRDTLEDVAARELLDPGAPERIISAGGSSFFDVIAEEFAAPWDLDRPVRPVLRSGCYITHDHGIYSRLSPLSARLEPAIELWAQVLSRPEPERALLGAGRRDVGWDQGLPTPLEWRDADGRVRGEAVEFSVTSLDDQHAYLSIPASSDLEAGALVRLGISHPCTTLDKWRAIPILDDDDRVIDLARTYF